MNKSENLLMKEKLKKLRKVIKDKGAVAVAFSGGIDSTLIAKVAREELKGKAIAVTINSDTFSDRELAFSLQIAQEIGIKHIIVKHSELDNELFVKNPANRCYHCKKEEMTAVKEVATEHGITTIAFGVNISDHNEHRPGITALKEEKYFLPLEEAEIGKPLIPKIAKHLGLSNYNMPSTTCLASRIPYGQKITAEKLKQIEEAEDFLYHLGISQSRVRHHESIARIEVWESEIPKVVDNRLKIQTKFKGLGFSYITLDLKGYRSGSMDEIL